MQIPVIDISSSNSNAASELLAAATQYGFVFIENSREIEIAPSSIAEMFELSRQFFASPIEVKETVAISSNKAGKNHGWLSRGIEKLDPATQIRADVKEAFNIGEPIANQLQQPLPSPLQPHQATIIAFQNTCHAFTQRIFTTLARALEIEATWFTTRHDRSRGPSGTVLRLLYYPRVSDAEEGVDIRAGAHSDFGSLTLLFQQPGQPGLEILTPEGNWVGVPVDPHDAGADGAAKDHAKRLPILVNIGDLLEDWTGGLLKSTVHRVVFPRGEQRDRYSIAYFSHPLDDAELEPVPSRAVREFALRTGKGSERHGTVITAKDHLMNRLAATYSITT